MPAKKGTSITLPQWCLSSGSNLMNEWVKPIEKEISEYEITTGSKIKVLWRGICNHEWIAPVYSRVDGKGCPYCHGKKVLEGFNDLASQFPKLVDEWDFTKNNLKPNEIYYASNLYAHWICKEGHKWEAQVKTRTLLSRGCKYCAGQAPIVGHNDLLTLRPDLAKEWHPIKNGNLKPTDVMPGSNKHAWWLCERGHTWRAVIDSRGLRGNGCPTCSYERKVSLNEKAIAYYLSNYFNVNESIRLPFLQKMELDLYLPDYQIGIEYDGQAYHKNINRDLKKNQLCAQNNIKLIRLREPGCPPIHDCECILLPTTKPIDVSKGIQELIQKLNQLTGKDISCDVDIERESTQILEKMKMSIKLNSLATTYPEVALEWHPTMNGCITPELVNYASNRVFWWKCKSGHEWQAEVYSRTNNNCGCPYCSGKRVIPGETDFATSYPELLEEWDYSKNKQRPDTFHPGSHKKVWWIDKLGHSYDMSIEDRTLGCGCPYCASRRVLKGFNDFKSQCPEVATQWDYSKNDRKPEEFTRSSNYRAWWICEKGHSWDATINKRTSGRGCPYCSGRRKLKN